MQKSGDYMNLYFELLQEPIFTMEYVNQYYNNIESARSAVKRLIKQKLAVKIRSNLYTCISGETCSPVASRYQIACHITKSAYISHHTAIEYHGLSDQVYYDVYVSSKTRFQEFDFDGYTYKYIAAKGESGVVNVQYSGGVRVTDMEKTLIDSIKDMDRISGIEEVVAFIQTIRKLDEKKLCKYLEEYDNQFLFQKVGYLLETYYASGTLSEEFYKLCKNNIGKSKRYLSKEIMQGIYNDEWKLIVSDRAAYLKNGVNSDYDRI